MDKKYAIKVIKKEGVISLIRELIDNNEKSLAYDIIESCFIFSDSDVIEYIEEDWEY